MSKQDLQKNKRKEVKKTRIQKTILLINKKLNLKKEEKWKSRYQVSFMNIKR